MLRRSGRTVWRASPVALAALLVTACGGGAAPATDVVGPPTATSEPASLPTLATAPPTTPTAGPSPTATVVAASGPGQPYTSELFDYTVTMPAGWQFMSGGGQIGPLKADLFTGPTVDEFVTNVNIVAEPLPAGITETKDYFRAQAAGLQAAQVQFSPVESVQVGSTGRATLITYTNDRPDPAPPTAVYRVYQVVFVMQNRGWIMTLSTSEAASEAGLADFQMMLRSFQPR